MSVTERIENPNAEPLVERPRPPSGVCARCVSARLVSVNGGIALAICIFMTAITAGAALSGSFAPSQSALFAVLTVAAWLFLIDCSTERIALENGNIVRRSSIGRESRIELRAVRAMLLEREEISPKLGIDRITIIFQDGRRTRMALGPCWNKEDLEAFLASTQEDMSYGAEERSESEG